ncbi:hypothetical protein MJO28_000016 [Puccinia striiformis f. sp. tritici]|uniref:Uncharacterized protein n=1 Tax=Puccinia striiformis f. sp. tritici TaxID=168172 RepID=A0ACC0EWX0_9BASI|nr:hypothetical protein MJO28_000016 [Puccinia striiformis f. sp. tritici]
MIYRSFEQSSTKSIFSKPNYSDYDGENSYESAAKFVHWNVLQLCQDPKEDIITHFPCATNSQDIRRSCGCSGVNPQKKSGSSREPLLHNSLRHLSCLLMRAPFSCKDTSRATLNYTTNRDDTSPYACIDFYITQTNQSVSHRLLPRFTPPQKLS